MCVAIGTGGAGIPAAAALDHVSVCPSELKVRTPGQEEEEEEEKGVEEQKEQQQEEQDAESSRSSRMRSSRSRRSRRRAGGGGGTVGAAHAKQQGVVSGILSLVFRVARRCTVTRSAWT